MAPKPIKSCGKVHREFVLNAGERDTIAASMAAEGISSMPEFIEMIDQRAASGEKDRVSEAVLIANAKKTSENCRVYKMDQLQSAIIESAGELAKNDPFVMGFEFRKKIHDDALESARAVMNRHLGKPDIVLNEQESSEFKTLMESEIGSDIANTDQSIIEEVGYVLAYMRKSILEKLGVKQGNNKGQMIDPDDEAFDDVQMGDVGAFAEGLRGTTYIAKKDGCCGTCCGHNMLRT